MKFNKTEYDNNYIKDKYDRINFTAPKGYKDKIQKRAEELGYERSGPYIKSLIDHDLKEGGVIAYLIKTIQTILSSGSRIKCPPGRIVC